MGHGVYLPVGPGRNAALVFAKLDVIVADEKALKAVFHFRGASGWHCCPLCVNVMSQKCPLLKDNFFKPVHWLEKPDWVACDNDSARNALKELRDLYPVAKKKTF